MGVSMDLEITADNTEEIKEIARQQLLTALEAVGLQAEGNVKREIRRLNAIDTGRLLNSITHGVDASDNTAYVGTNVDYAPYVEYGTSKMEARPYLKNGVQKNTKQYKAIFETYMKDEK